MWLSDGLDYGDAADTASALSKIGSLKILADAQGHLPLALKPENNRADGFAVRPLAETVTAFRADGTRVKLTHVADGLWQGLARGPGQAYTLETTYPSGPAWTADDPYRFVPIRY